VEDWAAEVEKRVRRDRPELLSGSLNGGGRCRRYKLAWRAGEIDPDHSSISFPGGSFSGGDPTFTIGAAA
jgi:hypothetical protein